jgi:integrase
MAKINLTAKRVQRLLKTPGRYRDRDVRGLLLVVNGATSANWQLRYQLHHREHWLGLGSAREFSLKEARERALAHRQKLSDGIDPLAEKRRVAATAALAAAKAMTFEQAATKYFDEHQSKWKSGKHRDQFSSSLRRLVFPIIGHLPVAAIDTHLVLKVLDPIWKDKNVTADRVRSRIESVLGWATVRGYRSGDNPAAWKGHLKEVLPHSKARQPKHFAAMPYAELPAFLAELRTHNGVAAAALQFIILTASRSGEALGAKWDEINFETATWTIPGERMKGGKEHRVPLSAPAIALLQSLYVEEGNERIFLGGRGVFLALLKRIRSGLTIHGFRSSFRDWCAERTAVENHVVEQALAHSIGNATERAYRRSDLFTKRARLMDAWASYCSSTPAAADATVVPMRGTRG